MSNYAEIIRAAEAEEAANKSAKAELIKKFDIITTQTQPALKKLIDELDAKIKDHKAEIFTLNGEIKKMKELSMSGSLSAATKEMLKEKIHSATQDVAAKTRKKVSLESEKEMKEEQYKNLTNEAAALHSSIKSGAYMEKVVTTEGHVNMSNIRIKQSKK